MKMHTPWGAADHVKPLGNEGILQVDTPSHGGLFVPRELYRKMPAALQCNVYGGGTWFEEDCEWALVALAFPHLFEPRHLAAARETIAAYAGQTPYAEAAAWLAAQTATPATHLTQPELLAA
jgi:hypothetical protein